MKVLHLLGEAPFPADTGPRNHNYGILRLSSTHNECEALGFYDGPEGLMRWKAFSREHPQILPHPPVLERQSQALLIQTARALTAFQPLVMNRFQSAEFAKRLKSLAREKKYDLAVFHCFYLAPYRNCVGDIPSILLPHDAYSLNYWRSCHLPQSLLSRLRCYYLYQAFARLERTLYPRFELICPVSHVDARWLNSRLSGIRVKNLGIPIADEFFKKKTDRRSTTAAPLCLCMGTYEIEAIAYGALNFIRHSWPQVLKAVPQARLVVWGKGATSRIKNRTAGAPHIEYIDWVDDYCAMLSRASLVIYPQATGAGVQSKLQQVMAAGIAVVAHRFSVEPLGAVNGEHCYEFSNYADAAQKVIHLLEDSHFRERMAAGGRELMQRRFSMGVIAEELNCIYADVKERLFLG